MKKEIKTILFLLMPVIFLIVLAVSFDERNSVVFEKSEVVPNKLRGPWFDNSVEMRISYQPSFLRRIQLAFTKYPQVSPIIGETYLVDAEGTRYDEFILPTGRIGITWGGSCQWKGCMEGDKRIIPLDTQPFPHVFSFPFLLKQVPKSAKRVFLRTQFEAYGTPQQEIKILVRE